MANVLETVSRNSGGGIGATAFLSFSEMDFNSQSSEVIEQVSQRSAGTFSMMYFRSSTNANAAVVDINFRNNTVTGNQTVRFGIGATGEQQDTTHTDTVVAGDKVCSQILLIGAGSFRGTVQQIVFAATSNTVKRFLGASIPIASSSATLYVPFAGTSTNATEALTNFKLETGGTLQNYMAYINTNARAVVDVIGLRKNNTTTLNSTVSTTASTGTVLLEDTTHTDTVVATDLVNQVVTCGASVGSMNIRGMGPEFLTTNSTFQCICGNAAAATIAANATNFVAIGGNANVGTTETFSQSLASFSFTSSFLQITITSNGVTAGSTVTFRKNGADGNQTISIGASTNNLFEDTTHNDTVVSTDELSYKILTGGTGTNLTTTMWGMLGTVGGVTATVKQLAALGVG